VATLLAAAQTRIQGPGRSLTPWNTNLAGIDSGGKSEGAK